MRVVQYIFLALYVVASAIHLFHSWSDDPKRRYSKPFLLILLALFYILMFVYLLRLHCHRKHYLIPLLFGVLCYGFFELACAPFDYWHLSNMFTVCLFFLPAASGIKHASHRLPVHLK